MLDENKRQAAELEVLKAKLQAQLEGLNESGIELGKMIYLIGLEEANNNLNRNLRYLIDLKFYLIRLLAIS